jgi:hypothetical protein
VAYENYLNFHQDKGFRPIIQEFIRFSHLLLGFFHRLTVVFTHTRRRWAFVRGLLAAGWREHGVLRIFFYFFLFFSTSCLAFSVNILFGYPLSILPFF